MSSYEVLLISRYFQHPRQFKFVLSGRVSGEQLARLLRQQFPEPQWYAGMQRLEDLEVLPPSQNLILNDFPKPREQRRGTSSCLKLYVVQGPDAGAWLPLTRGEHLIGRAAPLWLSDPLISRNHAKLTVTARQLHLESSGTQQILLPDGSSCTATALKRGSRFCLGETQFAVGDPLGADSSQSFSAEQLEIQAPAKPEVSRLVTLILAAFVPVLSGVLLAAITGSKLFLILSGVSVLMGLVPISQLHVERRAWKRAMLSQRRSAIEARNAHAAPLGQALLAGFDGISVGMKNAQLPPLVWGQGLWFPQSLVSTTAKGWQRIFKFRRKPQTDAPWFGPIFFPSLPGVWQLVGPQNDEAAAILSSVLARYLPAILAGKLELVIDPSIRCLPASLLLLDNVRMEHLPAISELRVSEKNEAHATSIYVTARSPHAIPGTLVLALGTILSDTAEHWIVLASLDTRLPDERLVLQKFLGLRVARFDRIIQQFLTLKEQERAGSLNLVLDDSSSIYARVGLDDHSDDVCLDLDRDGPHLLLCGTTGSGKSEALRRIVSDLAGRYSPIQLSFVLVDFKGGAGLGVFKQLPHVQLFVDDLDEAAAQRTLEQLEHEVRRREEIFAAHGCSDIHEYQQLVDCPVKLPRLLVVVDEFRVFIETLPQATVRIDRLSAVGRALGIHLLLSTQRPSGALTGQTRANLNAVVALKVNDPSESVELVGSADASKLKGAGHAIIKSSSGPTRAFQFLLAIEPPLQGELFERNREDLSLIPVCIFEKLYRSATNDPLRDHVTKLTVSWKNTELPTSGFAPALPVDSGEADTVESWPGMREGSIYCGVIDNLSQARLEPLVLNPLVSSSLLVCGMPDAGSRQFFSSLARSSRKILCFGPSPLPDEARNLKVITGEDPYSFFDAVEFLESMPQDPSLIILVHSLTQLQSTLHPQHFQRLDEALGALLRRGGENSPLVVCAVDRDQNTMKSTALYIEQWYFPLHATSSLQMIWPKLPPCSQAVGRGVRVIADQPSQVFQLADIQVSEGTPATWPLSQPTEASAEALGYSPFSGSAVPLPTGSCLVAICPDDQQRLQLSIMLAHRWHAQHVSGCKDLEQIAQEILKDPPADSRISLCVYLESTNELRLPAVLDALKTHGIGLILFVPPSGRLGYELGLGTSGIDDRQFMVFEAEHPQDLQPLNWPPLQPAEPVQHRGYWRAIVTKRGKPFIVHVPATPPGETLTLGTVSEEGSRLGSEEHDDRDSGDQNGRYRGGRHQRDIGSEE